MSEALLRLGHGPVGFFKKIPWKDKKLTQAKLRHKLEHAEILKRLDQLADKQEQIEARINGIKENGFEYCPCCGKKIVELSTEPEG